MKFKYIKSPVPRDNYIIIPPDEGARRDRTPPAIRPIDLDVFISTHKREVSYIHQTIASLYLSGFPTCYPINLVVNNLDASYLKDYNHHKNVAIHPLDQEDWEKIKNDPPTLKGTFNYCKCMNLASCKYTLIIEDDVVFLDGWFDRLTEIIRDIERDGYKKFALCLNHREDVDSKKTYAQLPAIVWTGTHGTLYSKEAIPDIAGYVWEHVFLDKDWPKQNVNYDIGIRECCHMNHIPVFTSKTKYVIDVGDVGITDRSNMNILKI